MTRAPLDAFDDDVVAAVAADRDLSAASLAALVERHQRLVRELPGVEDVVYEWRKTLPHDPLVERREAAYYLVVDPVVWTEYGDALDLDAAELAALRAVHDRQLRNTVDSPAGDREPIVLTRE